jgi:serine/threonine-protein kinase ULK2
VLKRLNHPNVLKCYEVFTSNRNCYIITELCNEGDLESKLRKLKYFDERTAEPIIRDIYEGLRYLGEKNVIHRDLKVANVFMHNNKAKVADFGFAKFTKYPSYHKDKSSRT